jgi:hypothetical protein
MYYLHDMILVQIVINVIYGNDHNGNRVIGNFAYVDVLYKSHKLQIKVLSMKIRIDSKKSKIPREIQYY